MSGGAAVAMAVAAFAVAGAGPASAAEPLGVVGHQLGRFAPDTLAPVGPTVRVGEPHAPGALSPDGRRLAMGLSEPSPGGRGPRVGLWIVDAATLEVLHRVPTGIAAEAVAFPGLAVALLQHGELVVVDPATGAIVRRTMVGFDSACMEREAAAFPGGAAFALRGAGAAVRLAVVDARGRLRIARLPGLRSRGCGGVGLAVDRAGRRAFVVGDGGRVAAVDLRRLRVRYREPRSLRRTCPRGRTCAERWTAVWLRGRGLAYAGVARWEAARGRADGARRRGAARDGHAPFGAHGALRDSRASGVVATPDGGALALGGGVRRYAPNGTRRWWALRGVTPAWAQVAGGRAYVPVTSAGDEAVLDLATGRVRGQVPATPGGFWLRDARGREPEPARRVADQRRRDARGADGRR